MIEGRHGATLAPAAFSELLPSISALYNRPIDWGWGAWLRM